MMNRIRKGAALLAGVMVMNVAVTIARAQYVGPESGQKLIFVSDSVFRDAEIYPFGPGTLITSTLQAEGKKIDMVGWWTFDHSSTVILREMTASPPAKTNNFVIVSCGILDAATQGGIPVDQFQKNFSAILDMLIPTSGKVLVMTTTMNGEDPAGAENQRLIPYNQAIRDIAAQKHCLLADVNAAMQASLIKTKAENPKLKGNLMTKDGLCMNSLGNELIASTILKTMGVTDAELAADVTSWQGQPQGQLVPVIDPLTVRQYFKLRDLAAEQGKPIEAVLADDLNKIVQDHLNVPAKP